MNATTAQPADAVTVEQLRFSYRGGPAVLDMPHWSVPAGGIAFARGISAWCSSSST